MTVMSLNAFNDARCKMHPLYASITSSFLNVWDDTQVACAMISVFLWNARWRHGRSRGETKCCQVHKLYDSKNQFADVANIRTWLSINAFHTTCNCRRQVGQKFNKFGKNVKIVEFHDHIWNHHEKYINISINIPGIGFTFSWNSPQNVRNMRKQMQFCSVKATLVF